ncbi:ATP-binding protein [uncultured Corynebacterium sp.]|uniref:ATP-binding protein n=1 Tax=uncultured Corynebacterium sp. TaxID=159447 RepID=UPI0025EC9E8B|nr:AAA family ATPase [uncultured Corynebacterium sp.]
MASSRSSGIPGFPFSAIVGQDRLRLALLLTAISPGIGGVVARGEKGTAKTTAVRALGPLLPKGAVVDLPLGATEDRVVGSIDVEAVLTTGHADYRPGLLSKADGGALYVDEVNLLADHLVDVLLDAAATGRVSVERDGVSHVEETSFVLVGTMNPEEGELRPQLLDRFGLAVDVSASRDPETRVEILRRRLAYEADPRAFAASWAEADGDLRDRLERARAVVGRIPLDDVHLARIASLCADFDVDGMRADLVIARTARAHAAWRGAEAIASDDIRVAAELALPHRRRRDPFDEPGVDQGDIDDALDRAEERFPDEPEGADESTEPNGPDDSANTDGPDAFEPPADAGRPDDAPDSPQAPSQTGGSARLGDPFRGQDVAPRRHR